MAEARGFLGCSLLNRHGGPVLHEHWWCGCHHRSPGVHFRRPYGIQAGYHRKQGPAYIPRTEAWGLTLGSIRRRSLKRSLHGPTSPLLCLPADVRLDTAIREERP
jgi:hypothetical protein